jgi:two-component system, NarL family, response regulator DevR
MLSETQPIAKDSSDGKSLSRITRRQIRLMVVDDHPAVRWGLQRLLEDQPDFELVAVSATAETALGQAERHRVDVALVDYHLGGRNGLWLSRKLKRLPQPPFVIIFSAYANSHLAANCVVAEVDALLSKGSLGSELCDAIRLVAHGKRLLPSVPGPMAGMLRRGLDDTEQAIFGMRLAGLTRVEIMQTLAVSARELALIEDAILRKLERFPGEGARSAGAPRRTDPEELVPH